jgi:hypothetical protein
MPLRKFKSSSLLGNILKNPSVELDITSSSKEPTPSPIANSDESGNQNVHIGTSSTQEDKGVGFGFSDDQCSCGYRPSARLSSSRKSNLKQHKLTCKSESMDRSLIKKCDFEGCDKSYRRSDNLKYHQFRNGHLPPSDLLSISNKTSGSISQRSSYTIPSQQIRSTDTSQGFVVQNPEIPTATIRPTSSEVYGVSASHVEENSTAKNVVAWIEPTSDKYRIQNPVSIPVTKIPVAKSHNTDETSESGYKRLSIEFTDIEEKARFQREIQRIQRLHTSKRLSGDAANETPIQESQQVISSRANSNFDALAFGNIAAGMYDDNIGADLNPVIDGNVQNLALRKIALRSHKVADELSLNVEPILEPADGKEVKGNNIVSPYALPSRVAAEYYAAAEILNSQAESLSVPPTPSGSIFEWHDGQTNPDPTRFKLPKISSSRSIDALDLSSSSESLTLNEVKGSTLAFNKPSEKDLRCIYEESDPSSNERKGKKSMFVLGDPSDVEEDSADDTASSHGAEDTSEGLATSCDPFSNEFSTRNVETAFSSKRRNSDTWSINSITESIFSLESGMTRSTASSLNTSQELIERLVGLFLDDELFKGTCLRALDTITRDRFERNLRKLLIIFASQLRAEAKSEDERNAARYVKHRATNSAHMICSKLGRTENVQKVVEVQEEVDEADDESESDRSEGDLDNLLHLETFIKTSTSLILLKTALQLYVYNVISKIVSGGARTGLGCPSTSPKDTRDIGNELSLMGSELLNLDRYRALVGANSHLDPGKEQDISLDVTKQLRSYFNPDHRFDSEHDSTLSWVEGVTNNSIVAMPTQQDSAGAGLSKRVLSSDGWKKCTLLLEQLGIVRPKVQSGKTRIEWTCVSIPSWL